ncbi:unnamed protein product [Caenorhabditis angaria]|uniref:Uncharacterized protein n=1 Tax=Caenorhabditis angaria TaxID=860376 RepID=A0A9P1IYT9_9PELO|nr:unnamed protein product [Caenorhabditis angaria]
MRTSEERRKKSTISASSRKSSYFYEPGYPRNCEYCTAPNYEFATSNEFSRHIRTNHTTQEGGSFLCRYGENGVCQKLPIEGVCDLDFETHIRRFHTTTNSSVFRDEEEECMSLRSIRLTSETPTEMSENRRKFSLTR